MTARKYKLKLSVYRKLVAQIFFVYLFYLNFNTPYV